MQVVVRGGFLALRGGGSVVWGCNYFLFFLLEVIPYVAQCF